MADLQNLPSEAQRAFEAASDSPSLEDAKARFLGKAGLLTEHLKLLAKMAPDDRKAAGVEINRVKSEIEAALQQRRDSLAHAQLHLRLSQEAIDVTLPGRGEGIGAIHPVIRTWRRVEEIFQSIGFEVADGPEIETDWFNFTALNNPENHPARSMQDTFYLEQRDESGLPLLLRTHTSPMQVRYAQTHKPPIKVIAPGRTYRVDSDATH